MIKNILSYGFIEGIAKGLNKLTLLILPLLLTTIGYGKIGLLISIELVLPLITLLGLERAVLRFYSDKKNFKNFKKTISLSVLGVHIAVIILLAFVWLTGLRSFFGLDIFPDIFLVVVLVYIQGTNLIALNILRVEGNHKKYFRGRLFMQIVKFVLIISMVFLLDNYLAYLYGGVITAFLTYFFLKNKASSEEPEKFEKRTLTALFIFSWPFIFHGVAGNLLGNADKFILENFLSLNEVGLYTLAYSIGSTIIFAYVGISVFLEPLIYKEKDKKNRELLLNKFLFFTLCSGFVAYILICLITNYILPHIYDKSYFAVFQYIPVIAVSYIFYPYYLKSNYLMIYEKKSLKIAITSIISAFLNIALNIYFIPLYGIFAAVMITLGSLITQAILFVLVANKFKLNKEIIEIIIFSFLIALGTYFRFEVFNIAGIIFIFLGYTYISKIRFFNFNS